MIGQRFLLKVRDLVIKMIRLVETKSSDALYEAHRTANEVTTIHSKSEISLYTITPIEDAAVFVGNLMYRGEQLWISGFLWQTANLARGRLNRNSYLHQVKHLLFRLLSSSWRDMSLLRVVMMRLARTTHERDAWLALIINEAAEKALHLTFPTINLTSYSLGIAIGQGKVYLATYRNNQKAWLTPAQFRDLHKPDFERVGWLGDESLTFRMQGMTRAQLTGTAILESIGVGMDLRCEDVGVQAEPNPLIEDLLQESIGKKNVA